MKVISLFSKNEYYWKEKYNVKPNTVRKQKKDRKINGDEEIIIMKNESYEHEFFIRKIKDITFYEDLIVISWVEE